MNLKDIPTSELLEELITREGVKHTRIGPGEDDHYILETTGQAEPCIDEEWGNGPAVLIIVED